MPRVVPSDVVAALDRMFPEMAGSPTAFPNVGAEQVPSVSAVVQLVEAVPEGLIVLDPRQYAELIASTAYLRALPHVFLASRRDIALPLQLRGFDRNAIALIRAAMAACPDEAPAAGTVPLSFIDDQELRESIRLDISAANRDLANGEWKGATVLAGSAVEALLLWGLQEHERQQTGTLPALQLLPNGKWSVSCADRPPGRSVAPFDEVRRFERCPAPDR